MPRKGRKIYISQETAASIGPAVNHLADWLGSGKATFVISPTDLLNETHPNNTVLENPGILSLLLPKWFNKKAYQIDRYLTRQFQHMTQKAGLPPLRHHLSGTDYLQNLQDQEKFIHSIYDTYAAVQALQDNRGGYLLYINAPPREVGFKELFSRCTGIPSDDLQDIDGTEQEIHSLILAHEASHFFEQEQLDVPLIENINEPESIQLKEEITADSFAFYQYKKMLVNNEVQTRDLLQSFVDMRALTTLQGDFVHATAPILAQQLTQDNHIVTVSSEQARELCKACTAVVNAIIDQTSQPFDNNDTATSYKNAYQAAVALLKAGHFDSCEHQKTYAKQFVRALERCAPDYTRQ